MADPNTRQGKRTPVTLKIKFKSETLEQFIERYAVDVSQGGIFIRTKEPLAVGTQMRFEFQLRDASPLIAGEGTVVWTRENDPSRPAIAPGMGVRFDKLAEGSQAVLERILNEKAKQAPVRSGSENTKPPMFTDTPTRVAPAPVQEALLGSDTAQRASNAIKKGMGDEFNETTPLPRPMPFHGDQDDFDAGAFDEATKVRALDELIAQTAPDSTVADLSAASVAAQDAESNVAEKPSKAPERESAPTLPSPPDSPRASQKMGTVPPATTSGLASPSEPSSSHPGMRTQIGVEPAKAPTRSSSTTPPATTTSTPSSPPSIGSAAQKDKEKDTAKAAARTSTPAEPVKRPEAKSSGGPGMAIVALLVIAVVIAGVWFFVLRKKDTPTNGGGSAGSSEVAAGTGSSGTVTGSAETPPVGSGSDTTMVGSGSAQETGSGSAVAMVGSNNPPDVGSGSAPSPAASLVDITIAADAQKATVEISGGPSGPAPFKAQLEKDKVYKVRVSAPGYAVLEMDVKGGEAKATAKLTLKPRTITVTSDPAGAAIFVDNAATGKVTPSDVELTKTQAARKSTRVSLRKTGFKTVESVLDSTKWTEDAAKLTAAFDAKLVVQQIVRVPPPVNTGSGSATPPTEGSGATPTPPTEGSGATPTPPAPTPTVTPPTGGEPPTEDQLN